MMTRANLANIRRSVACYQSQSYKDRELVVVYDGDADVRDFFRALADPTITIHLNPDPSRPLGAKRNFGVSKCTGKYVMNWDDDDWSHPSRLTVQHEILTQAKADFCFLICITVAWPARDKYFTSSFSLFPTTMLAVREKMPLYPELPIREDGALVDEARAKGLIFSYLPAPDLFIYVIHASNVSPSPLFNAMVDESIRDLTRWETALAKARLGIGDREQQISI